MARESSKSARASTGLPTRELQELWFATRRRDWKSLVVVPASPGHSAFPVAQALGEVGGIVRMSPVQVINAEGLDLTRIADLVDDITGGASSVWTSGSNAAEMHGRANNADRAVIIAMEAVADNPLVLPLALAADAVLLCVTRGETGLDAARHTADLVGRDRIIGSVLLG